jgi:hypothetical protein
VANALAGDQNHHFRRRRHGRVVLILLSCWWPVAEDFRFRSWGLDNWTGVYSGPAKYCMRQLD